MKSTTRALIVLAVFVLAAIGLLGWSIQHTQAEKAKLEAKILKELSADDVKLILESQAGQQPGALARFASVEARETLLEKQFKPLLALASEARRTGVADEPEIKTQLELAEMELLAMAYDEKQTPDMSDPRAGSQPFSYIKQDEVDAYFNQPNNQKKFEEAVKALEATNPAKTKITEDQLTQIKPQYAKLAIAAERAKESGMGADRATQLQIGFQQAQTLARAYAERHQKELEVSEAEVKEFIAAHPEYDGSSKKTKAEEVLKRAKAGEDFAALANEFSEDPGNREQAPDKAGEKKGGLYKDIERGMFQPAFENAALALEPNQIADGLVETPYGYHIIKLERKGTTKDKDGKEKETYDVRHILIGTTYSDPKNPFARPVPFEQAAKQAAQQEKVEKFIKEIEARNEIKLPRAEDIKIDVPAGAENPMMPGAMPPGMDGHSEGDGHNHGAPAPAPKGKETKK